MNQLEGERCVLYAKEAVKKRTSNASRCLDNVIVHK